MKLGVLFLGAAVAVGTTATSSSATNFFFASGNRAASVDFTVSGTDLVVKLTNTSTFDVMNPADILTAVFFDVSGLAPGALGRTSAVLGPGSIVFFGGTDPGGVVGGEWAYLDGLSGAPHGTHYGISSSGLGLFGPSDRFPGSDLQPPTSPDGVQYGITSAGDNPATGNAAVTGANAMIKNQVVFHLTGLPAGFNPDTRLSNIVFQYGTGLDEPSFEGTPTPGALPLLGVAGIAAARRRRR